ncbi:MAG: hypothetical protein ACTSQI_08315 [Candidatus Helarchaeota archaeon]
MSETKRNMYEIRGAWLGFFGSLVTVIISLIMGAFNLALMSQFPGTIAEYQAFLVGMGPNGELIATLLLIILPILYWSVFVIGVIGLLISLFRTNLGIRFSGLLLFLLSIVSIIAFGISIGLLMKQQSQIVTLINETYGDPQLIATYGISVPYLVLWPGLLMSIVWFVGSIFMVGASPFNEAKWRTRRMKILARADTAERAGAPEEAERLYKKAGDISMTLREEDKASEYYAKSREIHEVAIQAVLEAEEKRKREELAIRRQKLEEQRREILLSADKAEENEDWLRASVIYKEAASLSVDLGEKKLAAQFTAKSKELQKRAKKARKEREKKEEEAE